MQCAVTSVDPDHGGRFRCNAMGLLGEERQSCWGCNAAAIAENTCETIGTTRVFAVGAGTWIDEDDDRHEGVSLHDNQARSICIDTAGIAGEA